MKPGWVLLGRVIAALNDDDGIMSRSGRVVVAAAAARGLRVLDVDGKSPVPLDLQALGLGWSVAD